jgi:hypothetical protein|nr:MAG TPA: hypothetical protein [Caudoviricetes sp.]
MKIGMRKPSIKKSISARTTGNLKRQVKKATIPGYGKKGVGWIKDPKKAAYNKVYNKTTFGIKDIASTGKTGHKKANSVEPVQYSEKTIKASYYVTIACCIILIPLSLLLMLVNTLLGIAFLVFDFILYRLAKTMKNKQ